MRQVMIRAWEIAREGATRFGGKVKEYFQQALVIAWKEAKAPKWIECSFSTSAVEHYTNKATLINLPEGSDLEGFKFWVPAYKLDGNNLGWLWLELLSSEEITIFKTEGYARVAEKSVKATEIVKAFA